MRGEELEARGRILDAAARLFADRGFAGTTVRDIASVAGLNLAMIHYYFGNKEGLYRSVFEEQVHAVQRILLESDLDTGTCRERLERFVHGYTRFLCRHSHFARIIQQELLNNGELLREIMRPQVSRNYTILRGIIEDGIRSGEFRTVDTEIAPISVVGMIAFFVLANPIVSLLTGTTPEQEGFETRLAEHTVNLLMRGIVASPATVDAGVSEKPLE